MWRHYVSYISVVENFCCPPLPRFASKGPSPCATVRVCEKNSIKQGKSSNVFCLVTTYVFEEINIKSKNRELLYRRRGVLWWSLRNRNWLKLSSRIFANRIMWSRSSKITKLIIIVSRSRLIQLESPASVWTCLIGSGVTASPSDIELQPSQSLGGISSC